MGNQVMNEKLKQRQEASANVEKRMVEFLIQFSPAQDLTVADVKTIALFARNISFGEHELI
jgi:hypothetical protein